MVQKDTWWIVASLVREAAGAVRVHLAVMAGVAQGGGDGGTGWRNCGSGHAGNGGSGGGGADGRPGGNGGNGRNGDSYAIANVSGGALSAVGAPTITGFGCTLNGSASCGNVPDAPYVFNVELLEGCTNSEITLSQTAGPPAVWL